MIKLSEVIDGLEFVNDGLDIQAYFNPDKNEIFYIGEYDTFDDEGKFEDHIESCIMLPSKYDIHEYSIMEDFIEAIDDVKLYNQLCIAINCPGAFRRFKDTCINFEIIEDWYKYREKKYKEIATNWCKEKNIDYEE